MHPSRIVGEIEQLDVEVLQHGAGVVAARLSQPELPANAGIDAVACEDEAAANAFFASSSAQQLFLRLSPATLYQDVVTALMNPEANTILGFGNLGQFISAQEQSRSLLTLDQSILLVWPQIVALVALTVLVFALAYVLFLRQEVRA